MALDVNALNYLAEMLRPWFHILVIWALAWLALWSIRRVLRSMKQYLFGRADTALDARRVETLMSVFRYSANIVITGVAIMLTLDAIGISVAPLLATAGVAGIAIGFGAQSLVKDFFTGLFLLIENQISEGDVVEAAGKSGTVERVTLRHIRIRDYDGSLHFIPNSMINVVTNRTRGYAYAVIDINVRRQESVDRVIRLMEAIGQQMRQDPAVGPSILEDLKIAGVEKVEDAAVGLRCRVRVKPGKQWRIRREFLRRMKDALDTVNEVASAS